MSSKDDTRRSDTPPPTGRQKGRPSNVTHKVGSDKVLDAAKTLLRQPRPLQISRAELAKEAGVDQKLVRYYFENYEDILDQVTDQFIQELEAVMAEASRPRKKASIVMRERVKALIGFVSENPTFFKLLVDRIYSGAGKDAQERLEPFSKRAFERHRQVISDGRQSGEFRDNFDPRLLYIAIIGMTEIFVTGRPVVELLFGEESEKVRSRYEKFIFDLIMHGIGSEKKAD